ncbi:MAG: hypothetical protein COB68_14505 [SAR202 cluster bacterium]|nr:MAG: hypothetical protein COB68_14505 [SAR202 cluster bacterium]
MAVCWLFPGKTVSIDCPCLDCNESISIQMRDGQVLSAEPSTIVGHRNLSSVTTPNNRER